MSTVFTGHEVKPSRLWNVVDQIRHAYKTKYELLTVLPERMYNRFHGSNIPYKEKRQEIEETITSLSGEKGTFLIELQLFEVDNRLIFRILEQGYRFEKYLPDLDLPTVWMDTRTDVDWDEQMSHKETIEKIDGLISKRHYTLIPIVERMDVVRGIEDYALKMRHRPKAEATP